MAAGARPDRRHLDESQRGMVAAKLANMKEGRPETRSNDPVVSQTQAAAMLNVSVPTVKRSKKVLTSGIPELQDMVTGGEVSAKAASEVAKLQPADQRKAWSYLSCINGIILRMGRQHPGQRPAQRWTLGQPLAQLVGLVGVEVDHHRFRPLDG